MTCPAYTKQLTHLTALAKSDMREWQLYAWRRAKELEADPRGLWQGITRALTSEINGPAKAGESAHQHQTKRL